MSIITEFRKSLTKGLGPRGLKVALWSGGKQVSNHMLEISTSPQSTVLYIKVSTSTPGFWGLTKNQIDRLNRANVRWFCVFLRRDPHIGYLLSGGQVLMRVKDGSLVLGHDGDYKVNQRAAFVTPQRFESIDALVSRVL